MTDTGHDREYELAEQESARLNRPVLMVMDREGLDRLKTLDDEAEILALADQLCHGHPIIMASVRGAIARAKLAASGQPVPEPTPKPYVVDVAAWNRRMDERDDMLDRWERAS